jgi:hypothetical protein
MPDFSAWLLADAPAQESLRDEAICYPYLLAKDVIEESFEKRVQRGAVLS